MIHCQCKKNRLNKFSSILHLKRFWSWKFHFLTFRLCICLLKRFHGPILVLYDFRTIEQGEYRFFCAKYSTDQSLIYGYTLFPHFGQLICATKYILISIFITSFKMNVYEPVVCKYSKCSPHQLNFTRFSTRSHARVLIHNAICIVKYLYTYLCTFNM